MSSPAPTPARFGVVVPIKPPAVGKSRLAGLSDEVRVELCLAFAVDTVTAVLASQRVERVLVVTDDATLAATMAELGAWIIPDGVSGNLNASLELAVAELHRRAPELRPTAVFADLPALRADELDLALDEASDTAMSFVADSEGTGSTMVTSPDPTLFHPRFGPGSRLAHLAAGAHEIGATVPGLRCDVDTRDDLVALLRSGSVGSRTSFVATRLRL